jgi:hypothetical protein
MPLILTPRSTSCGRNRTRRDGDIHGPFTAGIGGSLSIYPALLRQSCHIEHVHVSSYVHTCGACGCTGRNFFLVLGMLLSLITSWDMSRRMYRIHYITLNRDVEQLTFSLNLRTFEPDLFYFSLSDILHSEVVAAGCFYISSWHTALTYCYLSNTETICDILSLYELGTRQMFSTLSTSGLGSRVLRERKAESVPAGQLVCMGVRHTSHFASYMLV